MRLILAYCKLTDYTEDKAVADGRPYPNSVLKIRICISTGSYSGLQSGICKISRHNRRILHFLEQLKEDHEWEERTMNCRGI